MYWIVQGYNRQILHVTNGKIEWSVRQKTKFEIVIIMFWEVGNSNLITNLIKKNLFPYGIFHESIKGWRSIWSDSLTISYFYFFFLDDNTFTHLMIFGYSLSLPWESRHLRYITEASTLAGEYVFGSFKSDITDSKIVRTFCVGFHLSHGNSPLCGSSTGGCNIEIQRSPFYEARKKHE